MRGLFFLGHPVYRKQTLLGRIVNGEIAKNLPRGDFFTIWVCCKFVMILMLKILLTMLRVGITLKNVSKIQDASFIPVWNDQTIF